MWKRVQWLPALSSKQAHQRHAPEYPRRGDEGARRGAAGVFTDLDRSGGIVHEWRVFFIGPMRVGKEAGRRGLPRWLARSSRGTRRAPDHFDQMVDAVVAELVEHHGYRKPKPGRHELTGGVSVDSQVLFKRGGKGADDETITLVQPHELFDQQSISNNVFDAIDDSDLVIADMTDVRPAVVYELAFAHALGIWTMLLGSEETPPSMFYLEGFRHVMVDFSVEDIRTTEFRTAFGVWLRERNKRFDSRNPFTDFYEAPIPDISAANGLALGYFGNFLLPVLGPAAELVDVREQPDGDRAAYRTKVAGVAVVRPPDLGHLDVLVRQTREVLERELPNDLRIGKRDELYVDTHGFGDRTCEFVVDGWLVDIPRTVLTLARSPRLTRTQSGVGSERALPQHSHLSAVLIERFLEGARRELGKPDTGILNVERRFFYGSPEEIVAFLKASVEDRRSVWPRAAQSE